VPQDIGKAVAVEIPVPAAVWIGLGSFQAVRVLLPMAERPSVRVYSGHDSQAI
jgi:hypothetical protein